MIGPFPSGRFGLADAPKPNNTEMYGRDGKNKPQQAILSATRCAPSGIRTRTRREAAMRIGR